MKRITSITGFSLIELLIVIALLAIISSIGLMGFSTAQKRSRDANRKSDLAQYRSALESYANKNNGLYPVYASATNPYSFCATLGFGTSCTQDKKEGTSPYGYRYISDGLKYVLFGGLEAPSPAANIYFGLCSTGLTLAQASVPTLANCP